MQPTRTNFIIHSLIAISLALACYINAYAEPQNIGLLRQTVQQYHDSGDYNKDFHHVIEQAQSFIVQKIEANTNQKHPDKLAVVLDIDETALSNYDDLLRHRFAATHDQIRKDILKGDAHSFKDTLVLYQNLKKYHVAVFFITGRCEDERDVTINNLKHEGYTAWDGLYLRPMNEQNTTASQYKAKVREQLTKQGYTIVASIGDQKSDFAGGYTLKGFKLPNPFYYLP